jgi:excisionase family DNA binding protein
VIGTVRSIPEVAELLRLPPTFVRRLAREGQVPCMRGSRGAYLFTESQVESIVSHLTQPAVAHSAQGAARRRRTA